MKSLFHLSRVHIRQLLILCAAVAICVAAFSTSAVAQMRTRDVVGVAIGMTPDQAEIALKARNPNFRFVKVYWRGADGKPSNALAKLGAALPNGPADRISTTRSYSRPEALMVYFSESDARVYAIYRQVVDKKVGVLASAVEAQLVEKYGAADPFKGTYRLYRRMLDSNGQPNPRCGSRAFDWESAPGRQSRGCGLSIEVQFSDDIGPDMYATYQTWLIDHGAEEKDAQASQARRAAKDATSATSAQNAARANKQGL